MYSLAVTVSARAAADAPPLYDRDLAAWAAEQAAHLRAGRLAALDRANLAEELEDMERSRRRELVSRLTVLLLHLLKWRLQPGLRSASWRATILVQRAELADLVAESPSLRGHADAAITEAHRRARILAAAATGLAETSFPAACPWSFAAAVEAETLEA